jgi:Flp pilus assembly protein TadD
MTNKARELLIKGLNAHQAGDLESARGFYERGLALDPLHPDGNRLLGTVYLQQGRFDYAETYLRNALQTAPDDAEALNNLGAVLLHTCRETDALSLLRRALERRPHYADALSNLGETLRRLGERAEAKQALSRALALDSHHANALYNLGVLLTEENDFEGARYCLEQALAIFPGHLAARRQLANVHILRGDAAAAEKICLDLLDILPDDHEVRTSLASIYVSLRLYEAAWKEIQYILDREPDHPHATVCMGQILLKTNRPADALETFHRVLSAYPDEKRASCGILETKILQNDLDAALALATELAERHPRDPLVRLDLGLVLEKLGRYEQACAAYRHGLAVAPAHPALHFNLANCLLLLGRFHEGWQEYEWRRKLGLWGTPRDGVPEWQGESLEGKTLLIEAEQGLGDMIQFVRLAPALKARGATLVLECQETLIRLLTTAAGIDMLVRQGTQPLPVTDLRAPLLSLPRLLRVDAEYIPAATSYLTAPAERVAFWKDRLAPYDGLRVGIAWAGNPEHTDDANRSCPPQFFRSLLDLPGIAFYSLQKGGCVEQAFPGGNIQDHSAEWPDLAETAAFVANLDLVISVDTVIAHLAGALGQRVWTLLPYSPDWRWQLNRDDSPWYPTMRLFRAPQPRAWAPLIQEVATALGQAAGL